MGHYRLTERIQADEASTEDWRRKRSILLRGMFDLPALEDLEWFEGHSLSTWSGWRHEALQWRTRHAFALYWWRQFLKASTAEIAYATCRCFSAALTGAP